MTNIVLEKITKKFPGVVALDDVTLILKPQEVHVLMGENGAGKSTLMKILSGVYRPTSGKIKIKGKEFDYLTPKDSYDLGISIIYQELSVMDELSIMENLFVGKLPTKKKLGLEVVDYQYMNKKAIEVLEKVGLNRKPQTLVEKLSISEKQQCEIAKALVSNSELIIMDEPTTSLTQKETDNLFRIIRNLKREGKSIVYISHKMEEIKKIGDVITVLKDGKYVGTKNVEDVTLDEVIKMMVGREIKGTYYNTKYKDLESEEIIFRVEGITRSDSKARDVSFSVHKGEIVGFAGLVGSGRSELMNSIFGSNPLKSGKIFINNKEVKNNNPYNAIKNGMAMVTENRRENGFFWNFDIKENISIVSFMKKSFARGLFGIVNFSEEKRYALEEKENLKIKCSDINQKITELSGGNQQKVILGKWLAANSKIIIFDEPTKGIDVGSKSEIYRLMRKLSEEDKGIIMVSSDMTELLSVCDKILVYRNGKIRMEMNINEATEDNILMAASTDK